MKRKSASLPPGALLRAAGVVPRAAAVRAEVRSDASLPFDPDAAPDYLVVQEGTFSAFVLWRVELAWVDAQEVQLWLLDAPGPGSLVAVGAPAEENTRENALSLFIENMQGPNGTFAEYLGTFLESDISHASYTMVVGIRTPISRADYQAAWLGSVNGLPAGGAAPAAAWRTELIAFIRMMLGRETSDEKFLQLASNVGDLTQLDPAGAPRYPMIHLLLS
jgi:hypothetical protein